MQEDIIVHNEIVEWNIDWLVNSSMGTMWWKDNLGSPSLSNANIARMGG